MKKGKLEEFLTYLQEQVDTHSMYVWGGQGQKGKRITESWIRDREKRTGGTKINGIYRSYADIAVEFWKKQRSLGFGDVMSAFDCSGLLVFWLLEQGILDHDRSANGLRSMCDSADSPKKGYWLFRINDKGKASHVGVMVSDDEFIHAKGRAYGVVKEKLSEHKNYWDEFGKPECFDFDPDAPKTKYVHPKGNVRVRDGNGKNNSVIKPTATKDDFLPYLGQAEDDPYWYKVEWQGQEGYISSNSKYTEVVEL